MNTPPATDAAAQALALLAGVLDAPNADAAAQQLVARLVAGLGLRRAALGLRLQGAELTLAAVSGQDRPEPLSELGQLMLGAMHEAAEQGALLQAPGDHGQALVRLEIDALHQRVGGALACLPLAAGGEVVGALLVERPAGAPLGQTELNLLGHLLALAAPALALRLQQARPLHRLAVQRLQAAWQRLQQPGARRRRQGLWAAAAVLAFLAVAPLQHEVGGTARLEGAEQRVLAAPTDGFIKAAPVRPGDSVAAGAVLLELAERDLQLERERWASQLAQHENAYAAAMARADRTQAAVSAARVEEAQAQLALVDEQLQRSRLVAPFNGVLIQGDWSQSIGAPVKQGDTLVTVASTAGWRVVVQVDEADVALVQPGQHGTLRLGALPWGGLALQVERITPLAQPVQGRNVFSVQARLAQAPGPELRPGLEGQARLVVGRLPPLWAWLRPLALRARMAAWGWGLGG